MTTRSHRRGPVIALVGVLALIGAACGGGSGKSRGRATAANGSRKVATGSASAAERQYGYGPRADAHLQADVVVIGGGPSAIRSASGDGLTWTIDGNADGASQLRVGSVMFATSQAVGRVAEIHDDRGNRVVTLAPVNLTDVLRDGTIAVDQDFDLGALQFQAVPDYPGASTTQPADATSTTGKVLRVPPIRLVAYRAVGRRGDVLPAPSTASAKAEIGGFEVEPYASASKFGVNLSKGDEEGLNVDIGIGFPIDNFHIKTSTSVRNGAVAGSDFLVEGVQGLDLSLSAGAKEGSKDNTKFKVQVPITVDIPIPPSPATAELPVNLKISYVLYIETALTGSNSTLTADGSYKLNGPFGISGGEIVGPKFTVKKSVLDSISGISLAPAGVVAAMNAKVLLGIGTPALSAGPYGSIILSVGVTNGSALGASLVRCHEFDLNVSVNGGVALSLSDAVRDAVNKILPEGTKIETEEPKTDPVFKYSKILPDVRACTAGSG